MKDFQSIQTAIIELELHDVPVKSLNLEFETHKIYFELLKYDDDRGDYDVVRLTFSEVSYFLANLPELLELSEILNVDVYELEERYKIIFEGIYGFGMPNIIITIEFKSLEVEK